MPGSERARICRALYTVVRKLLYALPTERNEVDAALEVIGLIDLTGRFFVMSLLGEDATARTMGRQTSQSFVAAHSTSLGLIGEQRIPDGEAQTAGWNDDFILQLLNQIRRPCLWQADPSTDPLCALSGRLGFGDTI